MNEQERSLLFAFDSLLQSPSPSKAQNGATGPWLFGLTHPTALDAHLVVFIGRMRDVGREGLIPERLGAYADRAMAGPEWGDVMQGRRTMIGK